MKDSTNNISVKKELLKQMLEVILDNRKQRFEDVIKYRTRYITVILEDIFQSHNASAVLRSCDCLGIQDIHIIENNNEYVLSNNVTLGSSKWLSIKNYNHKEENTIKTLKKLKSNGYRIVATSPHKNDCKLEDLPIDGKFALLFGTEHKGLSDEAIENADEFVYIPMYGFTESYNISVSAALSLHYLSEKLRKSNINWHLTEEEIIDIKLDWARNTINKPDILERGFLKNRS
ncbi:MAG: RNA methyltransferase [Bacteroidales bacterium]|nr:RNA methyltransferase [Bacteroidales bacterium]